MSIPEKTLSEIRSSAYHSIEENIKASKEKMIEKRHMLEEAQEKMFSVEEKWIKNEISKDTYDRWYSTYSSTILSCKSALERLAKTENHAYTILQKNLDMLGNIKEIYIQANIIQKREFVKLVFDNNLYYQDGIYRTPTMIDSLYHNRLIMKEKGLLVCNKKRMIFQSSHPVESGRVELPSKQATKKLSTRLFPDWFFDSELGQEQPLFA